MTSNDPKNYIYVSELEIICQTVTVYLWTTLVLLIFKDNVMLQQRQYKYSNSVRKTISPLQYSKNQNFKFVIILL